MSLIRLLTAGSSLKGIKDRRSPYKMTQQHLLPKFGSGEEAEERAPGPPTPAPSSPRTGKLARERIEGGAAAPALPSPRTGKLAWERIRARFFGKRRT